MELITDTQLELICRHKDGTQRCPKIELICRHKDETHMPSQGQVLRYQCHTEYSI